MNQDVQHNRRHRRALLSAIDASLADEPVGLTAEEIVRALPAFPAYLIKDALFRLAGSGALAVSGSREACRYRLGGREAYR